MTLEEELATIRGAEGRYERLESIAVQQGQPKPVYLALLSEVSDVFLLEHPYTQAVNGLGQILFVASILPEELPENCSPMYGLFKMTADLIMKEGGSLRYHQPTAEQIKKIESCLPGDCSETISNTTWEKRLIWHARNILPTLSEISMLLGITENETENPEAKNLIYTEQEKLRQYVRNTQAYLMAKTSGLQAVANNIPALQRGEFVVHYTIP